MKKITFGVLSAVLLSALLALSLVSTANASVSISAEAAIVIDYETGEILFSKDPHGRRSPASMTKTMTAFIVYEEIEKGNLALGTMIPISPAAARISANPDIQGNPVPLRSGSYHSIDALLHLIMLPSSNGASVALADHISGSEAAFVERMNETASSLGMFTEFTNSHGALPHYSDAHSMGLLAREFIRKYPDILRVTAAKSMVLDGVTRNNTNLLLSDRYYEGADGFKTGTTREAGFCLISTAERDGKRIIAVVMDAPNNARRYGGSIALLNFGFAEAARRDAERAAAE